MEKYRLITDKRARVAHVAGPGTSRCATPERGERSRRLYWAVACGYARRARVLNSARGRLNRAGPFGDLPPHHDERTHEQMDDIL